MILEVNNRKFWLGITQAKELDINNPIFLGVRDNKLEIINYNATVMYKRVIDIEKYENLDNYNVGNEEYITYFTFRYNKENVIRHDSLYSKLIINVIDNKGMNDIIFTKGNKKTRLFSSVMPYKLNVRNMFTFYEREKYEEVQALPKILLFHPFDLNLISKVFKYDSTKYSVINMIFTNTNGFYEVFDNVNYDDPNNDNYQTKLIFTNIDWSIT